MNREQRTAGGPAPESVLIVRLSSIGDVVHTFPAYMALRRSWPETAFGWAVESAAADLVRRLPGNLRVHELPIQSWRRRLLSWRFQREARACLRQIRTAGYELAIDFQGLLKSAIVARAARTEILGFAPGDLRERIAARLYHRTAPVAPPGCHIVRHNLHLAAAAGARRTAIEFPRLCNDADERYASEQIERLGVERFAIIHTAANWPSKRYDPKRFIAAARDLHHRTGLHFLWIWGPGERESAREHATHAGPGQHLAPPTRLPQLVGLLRAASLFIGGDSAPLHLAVACGTPVVALFGPTDPARLGPLDPDDQVVRQVLPCSYCHARRCRLGTRECLESIPPEALVDAAMVRLRTAGAVG